jgi:hypothetical protein
MVFFLLNAVRTPPIALVQHRLVDDPNGGAGSVLAGTGLSKAFTTAAGTLTARPATFGTVFQQPVRRRRRA